MTVGRFVDVEAVAVAWLTAALPDVPVVGQLPDDFTDPDAVGGLVRVMRGPGLERYPTLHARVDVDVWHATRSGMWELAARVADVIRDMAGQHVTVQPDDGDAYVQPVDATGPVGDPIAIFWSPTLERAQALYTVDFTVA